jgi:hypothetical protein
MSSLRGITITFFDRRTGLLFGLFLFGLFRFGLFRAGERVALNENSEGCIRGILFI